MELQTAFYIISIIFMSLMLIILIAITVAIFIIRSKINAIERSIADKLNGVANVANRVGDIFRATKEVITK